MRKRDIPKQYRIPRPMAAPGRRQHPFWEVVPVEAVAVAVALLVALLAPLGGLDDSLRARVLRLAASEEPARRVVAVYVTAADVRSGRCDDVLRGVMEAAGARAAVLVHTAAELCPAEKTLQGAVPIARMPLSMLRLDDRGEVVGFHEPSGGARAALERVGWSDSPWAQPRDARSVPAASLADLASGRVPLSILKDKLAVVGMDEPLSIAREPLLLRAAGAIGGVVEDGPRKNSPRGLAALLAAVAGLAIAYAYPRRGPAAAAGVTVTSVVGIGVLQCVYTLLSGSLLLPLATTTLSIVSCYGTLALPRAIAKQRALVRATELLERAALIRTQSVHTIPDAEFFVRVATLAAQAHPADEVLVAELPPHQWHLKFWPNGKATEAMISERRRDIRRTPYSSEEGVPTIRVVRGYLVMKDVPVLVVPLTAFGDLEGYVFLCGARAEGAFNANPDLAQRLSRDLGSLLYRRRLGSLQEDDWRRTAGALVRQPERRTATLIEGARVALDDLRLFGAVLREAPVPLLYADSFADVRMLGKAFSRYFPAFGIPVPSGANDGPLAPGALSLARLLAGVAEDASRLPSVAAISEKPEGVRVRTRAVDLDGVSAVFEFAVRPLLHDSAGISTVAGYVASLIELQEPRERQVAYIERLPSANADPLTVVPVAELIESAVSAAARRSGRSIHFERPRSVLHAVVHRRAVVTALENFLVEAAQNTGTGRGPTIAVVERRHRVEISILDVKLGLPGGALKRALRAPTAPPEGLDAFGQLIAAIEDSHGLATVRSGEGWGVVVIAQLVRGRSPLAALRSEPAEVLELAQFGRHEGTNDS
jgi:hypothetical protein